MTITLREIAAVVGLLIVAGLLRTISLDADPPSWLSWSAGLYSDEGIYCDDARLWVLYHQHMQGNFHSSVVAPLQNVLLVDWFKHYGVSLAKARMVSVAYSLATLVLYWLALRIRYDERTALISLSLLAVSAPLVFYNRMALLETPALFWLVGVFLGVVVAEKWPRASIGALSLAGLFAGIAIVWKPTFALAAVPMVLYALWTFRAQALGAPIVILVILLVYWQIWYVPHAAELARANNYYLTQQYLPHSLAGFWFNIKRGIFTGVNDGVVPYVALYGVFLWFGAIFSAVRGNTREDRLLWLWLVVPVIAFVFVSYTPSRYFLIFWPALAALCARGLPLMKRGWTIALATILMLNLGLVLVSIHRSSYTMRDDARILAKTLPSGSWIAGQFAPSLCLDNSLRTMYVQKGLANDPSEIDLSALPLTHVLATRTESPASDPWRGHYNVLIKGPAGLKSLPVGKKFSVGVYADSFALP